MENKTIEVTGCNHCPFTHHSKYDTFCFGIEDRRLFSISESAILDFRENYSPNWCPLKENSITIKLKEDANKKSI